MVPASTSKSTIGYLLGHSLDELNRLINQSSYYNPSTEAVLSRAGLKPGMTVMDVGCGAGDVSLCIARMVGPEGKIIAIDQAEEALALGKMRAAELGIKNIFFIKGNLNQYQPEEPMDAIVGRLVLLYQPDPLTSLIILKKFLKPGGIMAFQEFIMSSAKSWPTLDFFESHLRIIVDTFHRAGMDPILGSRLYHLMDRAGMSDLRTMGYTNFAVGPDVARAAEYLVQTIRTIVPVAQKLGVEFPEGFELESLTDRLVDSCIKNQISLCTPMMVGVWGTNS